ncbi:uncharacterized protein PG998_002484 [Apiospora kogelbergensis]|uniref:CsbD-like domain-containing protein n=2 Tax=Apiospora TaxID=1811811 RepID=A0ABR2JBR7_9PEZI
MSSNENNNAQPGLVAGHAEYVKGAAESTIGSATGSTAWQASGEQAKAHAVGVMKAASEGRDATQGYGKVEEVAGKVTGCEGMQEEGAASKKPE